VPPKKKKEWDANISPDSHKNGVSKGHIERWKLLSGFWLYVEEQFLTVLLHYY
jgi:hypothetical protein